MTIRRHLKWLIPTLAITGIVVLCCLPSIQVIRWVGDTDLEIEFVTRDSLSGNVIPGATILVREWPGNQDFTLTTGADGRSTKLYPDRMCSGTRGPHIDTFMVFLPDCYYQIAASGYETTEWAELDNDANVRKVQRGKPAEKLPAKLTVEIALELKQE